MLSADEAVKQGIAHHQQGRIELAEPLYRQALSLVPNHSDALHLLGLIALQCEQFTAALQLIQAAIQQRPNEAIYYGNLGVAYEKQGDKQQAEAAFRRALELNPNYPDGLNNLGQLLQSAERYDEALTLLKRAIELKPDNADAWNNLGVGAMKQSQFDQANLHFLKALSFQPIHVSARCNLGTVHLAQNQYERAMEQFSIALRQSPNSYLAHHGIATLYLKRGELREAVAGFQKALAFNSRSADTWIHLGCALDELEQRASAIEAFHHAIDLEPRSPEAYFNLGRVLSRSENYEAAVKALDQSLTLRPENAEAMSILINQLQNLCSWERMDAIAKKLIDKVAKTPLERTDKAANLVNPSSFVVLPTHTHWELQYRCARAWVLNKAPANDKAWYPEANDTPTATRVRVRESDKIRLGYLSADYRTHVMASHMVELFELHDRSRFEVFGYSIGPNDGSMIRERIKQAFDQFVDCEPMSPQAIAERIFHDKIDVLIDLQGHTLLSRPEILARKPAPIQMTYLGFACTFGADYIDYVLVDDFVAPAKTQAFFTERLIQLPGCYQVNQTKMIHSEVVPTREECGLREGDFVFCAFNALFKITPRMFDTWMRILKAVDRSVLWIPTHVSTAEQNLRREAKLRGIGDDRIVFAPRLTLPKHMARHKLADLFLDTFPYNAHGTASLSLRSGVPIVTLKGETMASRVAGSLLREVKLTELIASDYDQYEQIALRLATNPSELARVRNSLAKEIETSRLFNCATFARNVELAYTTAFHRYQSGETPCGFKLHDYGGVTML
jgi:protein O-GlcNAc transferase